MAKRNQGHSKFSRPTARKRDLRANGIADAFGARRDHAAYTPPDLAAGARHRPERQAAWPRCVLSCAMSRSCPYFARSAHAAGGEPSLGRPDVQRHDHRRAALSFLLRRPSVRTMGPFGTTNRAGDYCLHPLSPRVSPRACDATRRAQPRCDRPLRAPTRHAASRAVSLPYDHDATRHTSF